MSTFPGRLAHSRGMEPARLSDAGVTDVGSRLIVSCEPDTPLDEVARRMATFGVHAVVVFREPAAGGDPIPWSVITDLDLARTAAGGDRPMAGALATEAPLVVSADVSLIQAAQEMGRACVAHAIIVDPETQHPVGIVSAIDVVRAFATESFR